MRRFFFGLFALAIGVTISRAEGPARATGNAVAHVSDKVETIGSGLFLAGIDRGWIVPDQDKEQAHAILVLVICVVVFFYLCSIGEPDISGHRLVALLLVIADAVVIFYETMISSPPSKQRWDLAVTAATMALLLVPLALIWFADVFGEYKGITDGGVINVNTPGWMIAGFGWLVLLFYTGFIVRESLLARTVDSSPQQQRVIDSKETPPRSESSPTPSPPPSFVNPTPSRRPPFVNPLDRPSYR